MTHLELVSHIAEQEDVPEADVRRVLHRAFETVVGRVA